MAASLFMALWQTRVNIGSIQRYNASCSHVALCLLTAFFSTELIAILRRNVKSPSFGKALVASISTMPIRRTLPSADSRLLVWALVSSCLLGGGLFPGALPIDLIVPPS